MVPRNPAFSLQAWQLLAIWVPSPSCTGKGWGREWLLAAGSAAILSGHHLHTKLAELRP